MEPTMSSESESYVMKCNLPDTVKPVYGGHPLGQDKLAVIERWPDYRVQFQQISTLRGTTMWLFYRG